MTLIPLSPAKAAEMIGAGEAQMIDVREPDEFARVHVRGALSRPLSQGPQLPGAGLPLIFTCRSGYRTGAHCERLAGLAGDRAYMIEGGLDAWRKAGLPVEAGKGAPLEIMRQVQIGAGGLALAGVLLGQWVDPRWVWLSVFVGAGLLVAGVTGFCGMARLLAWMPWNRR